VEDQQDTDEARLGGAGSLPPLIVLQEAVFSSPGRRAVALMDMLKRISYLLQVNVSDYLALVEQIQDPVQTLSIFDIRSPELHDDLLTEAETPAPQRSDGFGNAHRSPAQTNDEVHRSRRRPDEGV
jgi:hypothetical protein